MHQCPVLLSTRFLQRSPLLCAGSLRVPRALYSTPGKVKVRVHTQDGTSCDFEAPTGTSLMHAIRDVAGIEMEGACDGYMECATCHVHLSDASFKKLGEPSEREMDVLEKAPDLQETSRLACQIVLTPETGEIEATLPQNVTNLLR